MKRLGVGAVAIVALLTGCNQGPQDCIEAEAYLIQCEANPATCEQGVVEEIFAMGCDSRTAKGEGGVSDSWMPGTQPLCRMDDQTAATLASDPGWFNSDLFQRLLDEQTNSQAYAGNAVTLLKDGVQSYPQRLANIAEADVVLIKVYNFRDDTCGREVINALLTKLREGGKVFVQVDVKGNFRNPLTLDGMRGGSVSAVPVWLQPVVDAGGYVIPANAPVGFTEIIPIYGKDHEKYLMTWKRGQPLKLIMGGMNIGDEWGYGGTNKEVHGELKGMNGFRDTDVEVIGPVTEAVMRHYLQDATYHATRYADRITWLTEAYQRVQEEDTLIAPKVSRLPAMMLEGVQQLQHLIGELEAQREVAYPVVGNALIRHVANLPEATDQDGGLGAEGQYIEKMLCLLMSAVPTQVAGQQNEVRLSNAFFLPPDTFMAAYSNALQRGVTFSMLLNPPESIPDAAFGEVSRRARCLFRRMYDEIPQASSQMKIYEWRNDPEMGHSWLHHKIWSFGSTVDAPVVIGSSNLDFHSLRRNSEGVLLIQDQGFKAEFDAMLDVDFTRQGGDRLLRDEMPGKTKCFFEHLWFPTPNSWL